MDHDQINRTIEIRKKWSRKVNFGGSWNNRYAVVEITPEVVDNVHGMCEFFTTDVTPKKLVIHSNHVYVYTNDLNLIERVSRTGLSSLIEITEANVLGCPGTVVLKNPQYQYRSYFREVRLEINDADSVHKFLNKQQDIRLSPSLKWWVDSEYRRALSYYFIDHNDHGILTMLSMITPGLIRKTVPITAAK